MLYVRKSAVILWEIIIVNTSYKHVIKQNLSVIPYFGGLSIIIL